VNERILLQRIGEHLPDMLYERLHRRDLCIFATRIAVEVGAYFGVKVIPVPTQVVLYNAAFKRHLDAGDEPDIKRWVAEDGSYSLGVGLSEKDDPGMWNGHLVAVAGDYFGDYTINQAERLEHGIVIGGAVVGPLSANRHHWTAENDAGTHIEWRRINRNDYVGAADWRKSERWKPLVGSVIRCLK